MNISLLRRSYQILGHSLLVLVLIWALGYSTYAHSAVELRPTEARQLNQVRLLMETESWQEAKDTLLALKREDGNDLSRSALRLVELSLGQIAIHQNFYERALPHFENAYEASDKEKDEGVQILYNIGQLQCYTERWKDCRISLERWVTFQKEEVSADVYLMIAQAYAMTEDWQEVIEPIHKAMAAHRSPPVSWYQMEVSAWIGLESWKKAIAAQQRLLQAYPNKAPHWQVLISLQLQYDKPEAALATYRLGQHQGQFQKAEDIRRIIWHFLEEELPYYAGLTLENALKEGMLPADLANLQLLFQCWQQAREWDEAVQVLARLQKKDPAGQWALYQSELLVQAGRWQEAETSLQTLRQANSQELPPRLQLLMGTVQYYLGNHKEARRSFEQLTSADAPSSLAIQQLARSWLNFLAEIEA